MFCFKLCIAAARLWQLGGSGVGLGAGNRCSGKLGRVGVSGCFGGEWCLTLPLKFSRSVLLIYTMCCRSFWHQAMRQTITSPARFLTYDVFRFRQGSLTGRYLFILLAFIFSGLVHLCGELAIGIPWEESGVMHFFCFQTLGIIFEDAVSSTYRSMVGGNTNDRGSPVLWKRTLGYSWVLIWMAWTMPAWIYPISRRSRGEGILPFSLVDKMSW